MDIPSPRKPATSASAAGVRLLRRFDLPGAIRLKDAAGWNQTEQDWQRVMELEPEGCYGIERNGILAASATALAYGRDLVWIGMVLTLPEFRKQGCGSLMMQRMLDFCQERGVAKTGLDATDMGLPLYRRFGFETECIVERWERPASPEPLPRAAVESWRLDRKLDLAAFGVDRSRLLESLAGEEAASLGDLGYAMGRPGSKAAYFGPCVAKSGGAAGDLLRWFLSLHVGEPVYWDLLAENREAVTLARQCGFRPVRRLTRMARNLRPEAARVPPNNYSQVFAIAGFEFG